MQFDIKHRFTSKVIFTAEIECGEDATYRLKLGLAIKAAVKSRADLSRANLIGANLIGANLYEANLIGANLYEADLRGANLYEANLSGADLRGADLRGANLRGADLNGADLRRAHLSGAKWGDTQPICITQRFEDPYGFILWLNKDGSHVICAGCQSKTIAEYRAHVAESYPDKPKAAETLRILDYFEATLAAHLAAREKEKEAVQ